MASPTSLSKPGQLRSKGIRKTQHTPEEIQAELRVDMKGRIFFRKERPGRSSASPAGSLRKDGYIDVRLQGQRYLAHRLVWCLIKGDWPVEQIDHINGNRADNRIENLRAVSIAEQRRNVTRARNASGVVGVTWARQEHNWRASISVKGKTINLGHFDSVEEATTARREAEAKFGYLSPM